nr:recombinase family protein [Faecalibaculum rodentium]
MEMKKVVLYMRYSSANQTEQSIEGQDRVCTEYCARNDMIIVERYIDRARSASHDTAKRTEFLRMIDDARKRQFETVVVYKLDRFARDRYDSAVYKRKLKEYGIKVISATEALSDNPEGVIMESLLEGMAEYYSKELAQKVRRGLQESVAKRKYLGGVTPLGLQNVDGKLVPDPATAHIVVEAFELADKGWSAARIIQHFNGLGYRTRKGKPFSRTSLRTMMHSKKYIGYYVWGDTEVPNIYEKLIDEDLFWRVQEKLKMNRKRKGAVDEPYILTGKLFCGTCGSSMIGESGKGKGGKVYRYYKCLQQKNHDGCSKKPVSKALIEDAVINITKEQLTPERIDYLADIVLQEMQKNPVPSKLPALKSQLSEVSQKLENATAAILQGNSSATLTKVMLDLEAQQAQLQEQIEDEAIKEKLQNITKDMIIHYLQRIDQADPERLIETFVEKVILYDTEDGNSRQIRIIFRLDGEAGLVELPEECSGTALHALPWSTKPLFQGFFLNLVANRVAFS